ncbi:MORN repeat-containing protein 2 isoform X2 [Stegastes partitus]|uniref:MORN repeat containing 2 n=1 Tax=Stegastes partitus TaxID=144197 RepID=A0A3B5AIJ0_9TELE|nr:PREDICTED: MORN repeat-containing protein 2 isoform X2 [Stegastes partitus]
MSDEGLVKVSYVFPNGDKYEGECSRSECGAIVRSGNGKHTSASGVTYIGEWHEDKVCICCVSTHCDKTLSGCMLLSHALSLCLSQMHGRGTLQHPSGAVYEGEFKGNMYHGTGTYTFPDKSVYKGHFQENRLEGDGAFINAQGLVWTGEFHGKAALGLKLQHSI